MSHQVSLSPSDAHRVPPYQWDSVGHNGLSVTQCNSVRVGGTQWDLVTLSGTKWNSVRLGGT
jgi:hypothetical protein